MKLTTLLDLLHAIKYSTEYKSYSEPTKTYINEIVDTLRKMLWNPEEIAKLQINYTLETFVKSIITELEKYSKIRPNSKPLLCALVKKLSNSQNQVELQADISNMSKANIPDINQTKKIARIQKIIDAYFLNLKRDIKLNKALQLTFALIQSIQKTLQNNELSITKKLDLFIEWLTVNKNQLASEVVAQLNKEIQKQAYEESEEKFVQTEEKNYATQTQVHHNTPLEQKDSPKKNAIDIDAEIKRQEDIFTKISKNRDLSLEEKIQNKRASLEQFKSELEAQGFIFSVEFVDPEDLENENCMRTIIKINHNDASENKDDLVKLEKFYDELKIQIQQTEERWRQYQKKQKEQKEQKEDEPFTHMAPVQQLNHLKRLTKTTPIEHLSSRIDRLFGKLSNPEVNAFLENKEQNLDKIFIEDKYSIWSAQKKIPTSKPAIADRFLLRYIVKEIINTDWKIVYKQKKNAITYNETNTTKYVPQHMVEIYNVFLTCERATDTINDPDAHNKMWADAVKSVARIGSEAAKHQPKSFLCVGGRRDPRAHAFYNELGDFYQKKIRTPEDVAKEQEQHEKQATHSFRRWWGSF